MDVYPLTEEIPVRIELWGDEIDSIRSFDVESQRSVENMEQVVIYPATENVEKEEQAVSFAEYFQKKKSLFFFDEPVRLQETLEAVEKEYFHSFESRKNAGMTEEADEIRVFQTKEIIENLIPDTGSVLPRWRQDVVVLKCVMSTVFRQPASILIITVLKCSRRI